jgi:hypothetical protein
VAKYFDKSKGVYRDAKGKEIPYADVRSAIHSVADDAKAKLRQLTTQFTEGKITRPTWYTQSEAIIRKTLISSGQIGAGGRAAMDASLNGTLGARVRFHLGKFREMDLAHSRGEVSKAQLISRSEMYADAAVNVFETVRNAVMAGADFTQAMNVLGGSENHCTECPSITGWIDISDYVPPGSRLCLSRCRCSTNYR